MRMRIVSILVIIAVIFALPLAAKDKDEKKCLKAGDKFRDFKLPDIEGKLIKTSNLRKNKVLLLEFTTSWCKNCLKELGEIQILAREIDKEKAQVLEVNVLTPLEQIRIELNEQKRKEEYAVLCDFDKKIANGFFVERTPTIFIVDTKGIIKFIGNEASWKELKEEIDKYVIKDELIKEEVEK